MDRRTANDPTFDDLAAEQARLARDNDAGVSEATLAQGYRRTLRGLADLDAGRLIDDETMRARAERLDTDDELPVPETG